MSSYFLSILYLLYIVFILNYTDTNNGDATMRTVKEMVDYFGSQKYVAERLGVTNQTVSNWVTSNHISRPYRLPFYQLLKEFKYPNPSLVELHELKPIKKIGAK